MEAGNPVKITERDSKLQYVDDATGKTHEFEIPIRNFYVKAHSLVASEHLRYGTEDEAILERRVDGLATIQDRSSISIIGADETESRSIGIQFHRITKTEIAEEKERFQEYVQLFPARFDPKRRTNFDRLPEFVDCHLFFFRHDPEQSWSLSVRLADGVFDSLFDRTIADQVKELSLVVDFLNVYNHMDDHYVGHYGAVKWFLRPDGTNGNTSSPQTGLGKVDRFSMTLKSNSSGSLTVATSEDKGANQEAEKGLSPEAIVDDRKPMLDQLKASVDSLAGQVSRTGWLVGIAILVAAYLK